MCGFNAELVRESITSLLQKIRKIELQDGTLLGPDNKHRLCGSKCKSELAGGLYNIEAGIYKAAYKLLADEFAKRSHEALGTKLLS